MTACPSIFSQGSCSDPSCPHEHAIPVCELCQQAFGSQEDYEEHKLSKQHINRTKGETGMLLFCPVCEKYVPGFKNWKVHVESAKHAKVACQKGLPADVRPEEPDDVAGHEYCTTCRRHVPQRLWAKHPSTPVHSKKAQFARYRSALDEAEQDKHGVVIEGECDFGVLSIADGEKGQTKRLSVRLTAPVKVSIVGFIFASHRGGISYCAPSPFAVALEGSSHELTFRGKSLNFAVAFYQKFVGTYHDRLEITFEDRQLRKRFVIVRVARAVIGDQHDHDQFGAKSIYVPRKRVTREPETEVIPGPPMPSFDSAIKYVVPLPMANIPSSLENVLVRDSQAEILRRLRETFLPRSLNTSTYAQHFRYLLWIEEYKMNRDLDFYDIANADLTRHGKYFYLAVPGLAEKRPSVLMGDTILVQSVNGPQGRWFSGRVNVVRREEVGLCFDPSFRWTLNQRYNIRFKLNRFPLRRQHQALSDVFDEERVVFPKSVHIPGLAPGAFSVRRLKNSHIRSNERQLQAVQSILHLPKGSLPFVVFGPPGTGKTVTIVESILQLVCQSTGTRVMACAPSNSAADLIATRLKAALPPAAALFRYYAPSRNKNDTPDALENCICVSRDGLFTCPPRAQVLQYRVVVATCVSASVFAAIDVPRGHYSHIFIDEAGQATECEVMVPIRTMAGPDTNIVLSGDPKQLGPIIRSKVAQQLGLEQSMIERLMKLDTYKLPERQGYSVIKLTKNFRSHNSILKYPNERFYDNELVQCADPQIIKQYLGWSHLPNARFPIIFHAISGQDAREASSPSFFNVHEITQVKQYVQQLKSARGNFRTVDGDIGVITPYHAQCLKIRASLRGVADEVKVGSVEEFQGQERKVIIISTVRSSREFVEYDLKHTLGVVTYIADTTSTVAVTRAQALLIVVGDPHVLQLDALWRQFLNYVHDNGGWTGIPIPWDPSDPVDDAKACDKDVAESAQTEMDRFMRALEAMTLANVADDSEDDDAADAGVDRPWRDIE
ncbi:P-loop containing nucleoside triphosphate hydrolase protein [Fistulina hepatica ATCC 64428]|uniref:RNA helicase n=1 Tax=Fistulina hepatica ATCC 64428 TaxID=1128425 RepID=A0A0D7AAA4_9AGAR|nr:P-loop containing nucleoside triphosphate hydrolase protein [Fistulina hepatica ATCC 64428]